jgi:spermidine/putrescine transport system substrate-binding protein
MKRHLILFCLLVILTVPALSAFAEGIVNVFNWEDYISEDVLKMFEEETGITVNYMRFTTNEDMMIQVTTNPSAFDVVFPSDYCVERLIADGLLAKIDFANVPNNGYTMTDLLNPAYDPTGEYSVPYMWGTVGILYNKTMVKTPVNSWGILWDEAYIGSVFMMDSIRDTMGITLKYLGYSMNTRNPAELQEATLKLIEQKHKGIVKAYQVDETKDKMIAGEAALALVWSGDAQYAIDLNSDLAYVVPDEGSNIWVDAMVIPADAKNKGNAEAFINFLCRPDIAKINCEAILYSTPNTGAIEMMGETYTSNGTMNPSQETISKCEFFSDIRDFMTIYNTLWSQIKNAK